MKVAISIGDINGVGVELALKAHQKVCKIIDPLYCINPQLLQQAAAKLKLSIPENIELSSVASNFKIQEGTVSEDSGLYSFQSFQHAVELAKKKEVQAICTLPIHKEAWKLAGIQYKGHTDALRDFFQEDAIMMLGCKKMYVALYTEHIPLQEVPSHIEKNKLAKFLIDFQNEVQSNQPIAVLGLNPHAGDQGVLGNEEREIEKAVAFTNQHFQKNIFTNPMVPDAAFTPATRKKYQYYVAMYHDQGLAPLKALYFDEGVNISLNLPIVRTSVDHGTAFDIAYQNKKPSTKSYLNAIHAAVALANKKQ
ncbi:MAG: 4-hydroxythreonine-4-phosphate dehydrogenase [bacterium]|jgi:4-hydroxythreonine-4-phosphate dehydrogenase